MDGIKIGSSGLMVDFLKRRVEKFNRFYYPSEQWDVDTQQNLLLYLDDIAAKYGINLSCYLNSAYSKMLDNYLIQPTVETSNNVSVTNYKLQFIDKMPKTYKLCLLSVKLDMIYHVYTQNIRDRIDIGITAKDAGNDYTQNFKYLLNISQQNLYNETIIDLTQTSLGEESYQVYKPYSDKGQLYLCYQLPVTCDSFVIFDSTPTEYNAMKELGLTYRDYYRIPVGVFGTSGASNNYVIIPELYQYLLDTAISPLSETWRISLLKQRLRTIQSTSDTQLSYELRRLKNYINENSIIIPSGFKYDDILRHTIWWFGNQLSVDYNQGYVNTAIYKYIFPSYELKEDVFTWN